MFFYSRCRLADRWKGVKWISCAQAETASLPRPLHQRHTLRCHHFTELTCRRVRWSVSSASHAPVVESQNVSKTRRTTEFVSYEFQSTFTTEPGVPQCDESTYSVARALTAKSSFKLALYTGWSDVTESMVTIRSPFCGYNTI